MSPRRSALGLALFVLTFSTSAFALTGAAHDKTRANSYDNVWETGWVNHCRSIYQTSGKSAGFVLEIGDSITHANPYSQWPRYGSGKTSEDTALCAWAMTTSWNTGSVNDTNSKNGFYLAAADTNATYRGMTAASGIDTAEILSGSGQTGTAMPSDTTAASAKTKVADGTTYAANLHLTTASYAFADAQFAVVMLGTNDVGGGRSVSAFAANLASIVNTLEARNIVVVLSTIPPHYNASTNITVIAYNDAIRSLSQSRGLPLIDFYEEILQRMPGTSWNGTLLTLNDVHPSATGGAYSSSSDPYSPGGNAATHITGDACLNSGYLLRSWLTIQKLKEVKSYVVDGVNPPSGNTAPTISNLADLTINEDANTGAVAFTVGDAETTAASLSVTTSSSNTTLVPNANIVFGGSGANRTVTVTPAANQSGTATITVTISDGSLTASDTFVLTVTAVNDAPTISNIADQTLAQNGNTGAIAFAAGDIETAGASLTVTGSSSNTTLVPNANIVFGGSGANRTVTVTPAANQSGTATITVTISDGSLTASDTFVLTVNAAPAISNHPANIAVLAGQSATFSVAAAGAAPLSYQWQRSINGGALWSNVGVNNASHTTPSTIAGDNGTQFRCVVFSVSGSATSNAATLTVILPTVTLTASDSGAAEAGGDLGTFTFTRTGETAASLNVQFAIGGSATNGSDYGALSASVLIPTGSTSALITVTPINDAVYEGSESIVLTLLADPAYSVGAGNSATVTLTDDDTFQPGSAISLSPAQPVQGQPAQITLSTNAQNAGDLTFEWNFGDGATGSGASIPPHVYAAPGDYTLTVSATHTPTGQITSMTSSVHVSVPFDLKINFQLAASATPAGYLADSGASFGDRGNGYSYGWSSDVSTAVRDRNAANSPDPRYDTLIHTQKPGQPNAAWEIALPNGDYSVHIACGDPSFFDSVYQVYAENLLVVSGTPTATRRWYAGTQIVSVADGRLTLGNAAGSSNNKICYVEITQTIAAGGDVTFPIEAEPMEILKLSIAANFAHPGKDKFKVSGRLPTLERNIVPTGQAVSIDVGAAIVNLVLDSKGRGRSTQGKFQMKYSAKAGWTFNARMNGGTWSEDWSDGGINNVTAAPHKLDLPVTLTLGSRPFGGGKTCLSRSKKGKSGSAK